MPETRDCRMMVNIEPTLKALIDKAADARQISSSAYVRKIIMIDLRAKGLLTDALIVHMSAIDSATDLDELIEAAAS